MYDPWVDNENIDLTKALYFIGTNHDKFLEYTFPLGSIVIDPWRVIKPQEGVQLISIGNSK